MNASGSTPTRLDSEWSPRARRFSTLLDLAGEAAHSSERVAAPVACWLSARAGLSPEESLALAREVEAK